jgi:tetratricopeptide repeat protein 8
LHFEIKAVWYLKCRALTEKIWIDDTELEEQGVAEILLDDNAIASMPRLESPFHI